MKPAGSSPLDGLLVLSLEQAVAAPYCSSRLADAAARVIKVERPEGDFARGYDAAVFGLSSYFVWLNRGKQSLVADIKHPEDIALRHSILDRADVFIQNLAPGAAARAGLGADLLRQRHPRLITVEISGWRFVSRWIPLKLLPWRRVTTPKRTSPVGFSEHLAVRSSEGCTTGQYLISEICKLGFKRSVTQRERLLTLWRRAGHVTIRRVRVEDQNAAVQNFAASVEGVIAAAALCIKPQARLTDEQVVKVARLKVRLDGDPHPGRTPGPRLHEIPQRRAA